LFLEQLLYGVEAGEEVPDSIQGLVLGRMDRLPPADREALLAASVIGQRFALAPVRHLVGNPHYEPSGLLAHYLVRPEGEDAFLFAHALIQEGVYQSLLKARRRELHQRAAEWFADRDPVVRAQHLDRAGDPAAARAYIEAARSQAAGYDYQSARSLVERGLAVATTRADQYTLTCLHGDLLHDLGSVETSIEVYRKGLEIAETDAERCRAWLGLAAGMRVTDAFDEAFLALDEAQAAATLHDLAAELARIHHIRGNLLFPLGRGEECHEQHELSLRYAQQTESTEAEARAFGGLGDAEFARGRMRTAHAHFRRCLELCRARGFGRIEVANRSMYGFTRLFLNEVEQALADSLAAVEAAVRVGHARAELIGQNIVCNVLCDMADMPRLGEQVAKAQALVRKMGAWRFEAQNLIFLARVLLAEKRRLEAVELIREAWKISRETSVGFSGPRVLSTLALATEDPAERRQALEEGEWLLDANAIRYNHLCFCRDAIDVSLGVGDWGAVHRYATALEDYTRAESLPWADLFIARGRALATFRRGAGDDGTIRALGQLRDEARRVGLHAAVPALDAALAEA
jgi:tetratricopeptide (TPR) repeat protein